MMISLLIVFSICGLTYTAAADILDAKIFQKVNYLSTRRQLNRKTIHSHFESIECDMDNPCDKNSTTFEPLEAITAREAAFGEISPEFISSYAVEFENVQATSGIGGDWVNIGPTAPTVEGVDVNPLSDGNYIESGRIRLVINDSN